MACFSPLRPTVVPPSILQYYQARNCTNAGTLLVHKIRHKILTLTASTTNYIIN